MDYQLILGLFITILPLIELRLGLPVVVDYCLRNGITIWPFFVIVLLLNILIIFIAYFFLESIHHLLLNWKFYNINFHKFIDKLRRKHAKFEKRFNEIGYFALVLFVAIPLPGTGAWSGTLLAWLLGLDKKKAIWSVAFGVIIAGLIVLFSSLGVLHFFYR